MTEVVHNHLKRIFLLSPNEPWSSSTESSVLNHHVFREPAVHTFLVHSCFSFTLRKERSRQGGRSLQLHRTMPQSQYYTLVLLRTVTDPQAHDVKRCEKWTTTKLLQLFTSLTKQLFCLIIKNTFLI